MVLFFNRRFGFSWAAVVFFWIWLKTLTNWIITTYRISKLIKNRYSADGDQRDGSKSSHWRFYYAKQRQSETKVNSKLKEATVRLSDCLICISFDFRYKIHFDIHLSSQYLCWCSTDHLPVWNVHYDETISKSLATYPKNETIISFIHPFEMQSTFRFFFSK